MAFSKVILNGTTLMDVTDKTVTANDMLTGITALNNAGENIVGTYQGGSSYTFVTSGELEVSTTSISATVVGTVEATIDHTKWVLIRVRDKYSVPGTGILFYGSDTMFAPYIVSSSGSATYAARVTYYYGSDGFMHSQTSTGGYGMYASALKYAEITMSAKENPSYAPVVNSTYVIEVYQLEDPTGSTPIE